jgi:hypothetical protein
MLLHRQYGSKKSREQISDFIIKKDKGIIKGAGGVN